MKKGLFLIVSILFLVIFSYFAIASTVITDDYIDTGLFLNSQLKDMVFRNFENYSFIWSVSNNDSIINLMKLNYDGELTLLRGNLNVSQKNITGVGYLCDSDFCYTLQDLNKSFASLNESNKSCLVSSANFVAEESGEIKFSDGLEYSFGDNNKGSYGIRQPCSGKIVYLTIQAKTATNGNGVIGIVINGANSSLCTVSTLSSNQGSNQTVCNVSFSEGDMLNARTLVSPKGNNKGYNVAWWVRYD